MIKGLGPNDFNVTAYRFRSSELKAICIFDLVGAYTHCPFAGMLPGSL